MRGRRKRGEGLILLFGLQEPLFVPVSVAKAPSMWRGFRCGGTGCLIATQELSSQACTQNRTIKNMPSVTVTRRLHFNAAHRLHNPALSDEENVRVFGKCNNPNWHGHNYVLDVSVKGSIDARTGYVMDLGALRDVVEREIIALTDHRNFNLDVPYMRDIIPTTENIVVAMWRVLKPALAPAQLTQLRLWETEHNFADYYGE